MQIRRHWILWLACLLFLTPTVPARADLPNRVWRVNAPYFSGDVSYSQTAIFWYGQVTRDSAYTDVRVGYNDTELYINLAIFDRLLWYDPSPDPASLTEWDAATLYLSLDGPSGNALSERSYRLDGQLTWWEDPRTRWQAAYRGGPSGWSAAQCSFTTKAGWRGDAPNNGQEDRGWVLTFRVPFASLGLSSPPPQGTVWGLGLVTYDRNSNTAGAPVNKTVWPEGLDAARPASWGQLHFGMPVRIAPAVPQGTVVIRNKQNGAWVTDAAVGGGTNCGSGMDYWTQWGQSKITNMPYFNVQNQSDVSDWPCFSKYYVTFPLDALPRGKSIVSADFILHNWGNAGEGWNPGPKPSFIQVCSVGTSWTPDALSWNNAPMARENLGGTWVNPVDAYPGYPGIPYTWDVSRAVEEAYAAGQPLRLVVYSADSPYHSGRYFYASNTEDMNAEGRPTLRITWGNVGDAPEPRGWLPLLLH